MRNIYVYPDKIMSFYQDVSDYDRYTVYCQLSGKRLKECMYCRKMEYVDELNKKGACRTCRAKAMEIIGI
jgi:hypothetical protein